MLTFLTAIFLHHCVKENKTLSHTSAFLEAFFSIFLFFFFPFLTDFFFAKWSLAAWSVLAPSSCATGRLPSHQTALIQKDPGQPQDACVCHVAQTPLLKHFCHNQLPRRSGGCFSLAASFLVPFPFPGLFCWHWQHSPLQGGTCSLHFLLA